MYRVYRDGAILYGAGDAPANNELRILENEIVFAADQRPATDADQRVVATYAAGHAPPTGGEVLVTTWDGHLEYAPNQAPVIEDGDELLADYLVDRRNCVEVSLGYRDTVERYIVPDGRVLAERVNASSVLANAEADDARGGSLPSVGVSAYFGKGNNNPPGGNGADAGSEEYVAGLETIANQLVNIVVLAGQDAAAMGSDLVGHLKATADTDHERIGVIGAPGNTLEAFLGHDFADGRLILVGPGVRTADGTALPPAYTAAAVAGLISSVAPQTSLTNKPLNVPGLTLDFNRGEQGQLIRRNVLAVVRKNGLRVLKGITTSGEGTPFSAIPTRRIVDFAKYGVRSAADPYIGRLNNDRVRAALKGTLDAFLTRMVESEALTGFELVVSATRAQEIAGEVDVTMTIQPTFSIDFVRVTMNLS